MAAPAPPAPQPKDKAVTRAEVDSLHDQLRKLRDELKTIRKKLDEPRGDDGSGGGDGGGDGDGGSAGSDGSM